MSRLSNAQTGASFGQLLGAVERQIEDIKPAIQRARAQIPKHGFTAYLEFQRRVDETLSLLSVLESQLERVAAQDEKAWRPEFIRLDIRLIALMAKANALYFQDLNASQVKPLSGRFLFEPALLRIRNALTKLEQPDYAARDVEAIVALLQETEEKVLDYLERVPDLPDFPMPDLHDGPDPGEKGSS